MQNRATSSLQQREDFRRIEALDPGACGLLVNQRFVVIKLAPASYRIGELYGGWLADGTAEQIIRRAYLPEIIDSNEPSEV